LHFWHPKGKAKGWWILTRGVEANPSKVSESKQNNNNNTVVVS
jgi:hypothetical protein